MTHATCRLTAKNRDQLRNPTVGNRVRTTITFFELLVCNFLVDFCPSLAHCALFNERKVGVQLPASAVNVTLLALPLLRRRPCSNRSISRADSSNTPPPQRRSEGTDRQTRLRKVSVVLFCESTWIPQETAGDYMRQQGPAMLQLGVMLHAALALRWLS